MMRQLAAGLLGTVAIAGVALAQSEGTAKKEYDSGAVYEGQFKDGKQHGEGTYTAPDGYEYTGEWVDGVIQGKGTCQVPQRLGL